MATMITSECINCGACEPECPNNAISQAEDIYVIDPLLCTECVGFHDYEACAAVCPVDCCVTDPNNEETEDVLIARAQALHQDTDFGEAFQSRFRPGEGQPTPPPTPANKAEPPEPPSPTETPSTTQIPEPPPQTTKPPQPGASSDYEEPSPNFLELPEFGEWEIPIRCFKCSETYVATARHFMIGNVLFCPHCHKSMVIKDNLNFQIRTALGESYERWEKQVADFRRKREKELADFKERREKELRDFEIHQRRELENIKIRLQRISESYDAPGKPIKRGTLFGWG